MGTGSRKGMSGKELVGTEIFLLLFVVIVCTLLRQELCFFNNWIFP